MRVEKTIYLVRHGQSVGNITPVFQPLESPLSNLGKKQAQCVAQRVAKNSFEILLSSPLSRAKETAEEIAKITKKEIEFSNLFVERIKPTSISGKSYSDKKASFTSKEWKKSLCTDNMRIEDGENFRDIISRANKALSFLKDRKERSIVVVTHGYFLRTIVANILLGKNFSDDSFREFQKSTSSQNTSVTIIRYIMKSKGKFDWKLWVYNDHSHLTNNLATTYLEE